MTVMAAWSARSSTFDFGDALPNSRSGPVEARTAPRIQITCNRFSQKKVLAKIFGELGKASPYSDAVLYKEGGVVVSRDSPLYGMRIKFDTGEYRIISRPD